MKAFSHADHSSHFTLWNGLLSLLPYAWPVLFFLTLSQPASRGFCFLAVCIYFISSSIFFVVSWLTYTCTHNTCTHNTGTHNTCTHTQHMHTHTCTVPIQTHMIVFKFFVTISLSLATSVLPFPSDPWLSFSFRAETLKLWVFNFYYFSLCFSYLHYFSVLLVHFKHVMFLLHCRCRAYIKMTFMGWPANPSTIYKFSA